VRAGATDRAWSADEMADEMIGWPGLLEGWSNSQPPDTGPQRTHRQKKAALVFYEPSAALSFPGIVAAAFCVTSRGDVTLA
jgi:hypothetical protein